MPLGRGGFLFRHKMTFFSPDFSACLKISKYMKKGNPYWMQFSPENAAVSSLVPLAVEFMIR